ncbi:hypothetical protein ZEAMMB73_Zm00001d002719, partial [Zea mays]
MASWQQPPPPACSPLPVPAPRDYNSRHSDPLYSLEALVHCLPQVGMAAAGTQLGRLLVAASGSWPRCCSGALRRQWPPWMGDAPSQGLGRTSCARHWTGGRRTSATMAPASGSAPACSTWISPIRSSSTPSELPASSLLNQVSTTPAVSSLTACLSLCIYSYTLSASPALELTSRSAASSGSGGGSTTARGWTSTAGSSARTRSPPSSSSSSKPPTRPKRTTR